MKVLEEIKYRMVIILTVTTLYIRNEKLQKEVGLLINLQQKGEQTHSRSKSATMCFSRAPQFAEFCVALRDRQQSVKGLDPMVSLALKSLDLNLHTSDFKRKIATLYC